MAVTKVTKRVNENDTAESRKSQKGEYSRTRTYEYQVVCDSITDDSAVAQVANDGTTAIPLTGSAVADGSSWLLVTSVKATRTEESPFVFKVIVTGSVQSEAASNKYNVTISCDGIEYQESITKDINGLPIKNSAGDPFPGGVLQTRYDEEITLSFNSTSVDLANISATRGKVNSGAVTFNANGINRTCAAKTLKLAKARYSSTVPATLATAGVTVEWEIQYVFQYRADTWERYVIDQGMRMLSGGPTNRVAIPDVNGHPVTSPAFLDGSGHPLTNGASVTLLGFEVDTAVDFSGLCSGL